MNEAQYFEQFIGENEQESFDPYHHKDIRVHRILKSAGLLELPGFDWTSCSVPYSDYHDIRVYMVSTASHQEMIDLLKQLNSDKKLQYEISELYWQPKEKHFLRINVIFDDTTWNFGDVH